MEQVQYNIEQVKELLAEYDEKILEALGFEVNYAGNVKCACPIHKGDNPCGFTYNKGTKFGSVWKCWTHNCDKKYGNGLINLVMGMKKCSLPEAIEYALGVLKDRPDQISKIQTEKKKFIKKSKKIEIEEVRYDRQTVENLPHDVPYFLQRGFNPKVLNEFLAFYCDDSTKQMFGRACLPIFDINGELAGCTGRKTPQIDPSDANESVIKWKHSQGVMTSHHLFGIDKTADAIKAAKCVVLVEGPLDVLRCHEAGVSNVVSPFGISFSDTQRKLLLQLGASTLLVAFDPDIGGQKGLETVLRQARLYFNVRNVRDKLTKDPGEMSVEEIHATIGKCIDEVAAKERKKYG